MPRGSRVQKTASEQDNVFVGMEPPRMARMRTPWKTPHRLSLYFLACVLTAFPAVSAPATLAGFSADSLNVRMVGSIDTPGKATAVALLDSLAFVADAAGGLRIISVVDPVHPVEIGSHPTPGSAWDVEIVDSTLVFVADYSGGVVSFDVSDPREPVSLDTLDTPGSAEEAVHLGDHLFVADNLGGLRVIDIFDPGGLTELAHVPTTGFAHGVDIDTSRGLPDSAFVHVATGSSGLVVFSVFYPESPVEVGRYDTHGYARDVSVSADIAAVADGSEGLRLIDILDRSEPSEIGSHLAEEAVGVVVQDTLAYSANGTHGIEIVSVADPGRPVLRGFYDTPDEALGVAVEGSLVYAANGFEGLLILEYRTGTGIDAGDDPDTAVSKSWSLSQNFPNPFNPRTTIPLAVGGPEGVAREVSLEIRDVRGRPVLTLIDRRLLPGVYRFTWDGTDRRGVQVPSGVYFAACRVGGEAAVRKMLLAR